jgi:NAD(P)-dependent dehydrogenase (short-subunit alcohol dehydrogenase family)
MDPAEFGYSTTPLHHAPYGPIHPSALKGANKDKVAVITGAAQGIGAAIAISLSASGSNVAILDLDLSALQQTKQACEAQNVKAEAYVCDVTNEQTVKETFNSIEADLGPIDILINNAGIFDQRPFMMGTVESVWRQMEVNFKGPLITMHNVLGRMRDRGGKGCIINIASRSATVDVPMTLGYVTSKAALTRATSTLQREMGLDGLDGGIQFYALHPGGVKGAMGGGKLRSRSPRSKWLYEKVNGSLLLMNVSVSRGAARCGE